MTAWDDSYDPLVRMQWPGWRHEIRYYSNMDDRLYIGTLEKISSTTNALRTETVRGTFCLPQVGRQFRLVGESLTEGADLRLVQTSPVTEMVRIQGGFNERCQIFEFRTESGSHYRLVVDDLS